MAVNFNVGETMTGRLNRLRKGWEEGMKHGICLQCSLSLICASNAMYDICCCMNCGERHIYLKAANALTMMMQRVDLSKDNTCPAMTHAEVMTCQICREEERKRMT